MKEKKETSEANSKGAIIDAETMANLENLDAEATAEDLDAELIDAVETGSGEKEEDTSEADNAAKISVIIGVVEAILKAKWPFLQIDSGVKAGVFEKVQPVFSKYGDGFPVWLAPWKEEIELGIVLSVAGYGIHSQVAAHSEKNQNKNDDGGAGSEAQGTGLQ